MNNDDVKEKEQSLRDAVTALNVADVKRILRENPTLNVNLSLDPSNSLLHFAVRHDSLPIVQLLVERKADIEAKSVSVIPPLYWSAFHGFIEIVRYLCFVGADLYNAPSGWTPVHTAAGHNHDNVIELLATFGSSIDKLNSGSETPLKVAAGSRHHRAAHCLIALNANVSSSSASTNEFLRPILEQHPVAERETSRNEIINRTFQKNSILLMKFAHPVIVDIVIAMASLRLPPYVLLWIIDELPRYNFVSHHAKIKLIENLARSIRKVRHQDEDTLN